MDMKMKNRLAGDLSAINADIVAIRVMFVIQMSFGMFYNILQVFPFRPANVKDLRMVSFKDNQCMALPDRKIVLNYKPISAVQNYPRFHLFGIAEKTITFHFLIHFWPYFLRKLKRVYHTLLLWQKPKV
jgi:hypothetical protein